MDEWTTRTLILTKKCSKDLLSLVGDDLVNDMFSNFGEAKTVWVRKNHLYCSAYLFFISKISKEFQKFLYRKIFVSLHLFDDRWRALYFEGNNKAWKYFSEQRSYDSYLIFVFSIYLSSSFCENWCFQNNFKVRIFKYQKIPKTNSQAADHALESFKRI